MKKILLVLISLLLSFQAYGQFFGTEKIPEVEIELEILPSEDPSGSFFVYATFIIPENYHIFYNEEFFNIFIEHEGITAGEASFPMEESEPLLGIPAFSGTVTISREFFVDTGISTNELTVEIIAAYQMCEDNGACLLPERISFIRNLNSESSLSRIFWYVLLAFAGGLLLNIMPCVLPLLSVKALNLVEQSRHDRKTILFSSLLYGAGILASFLVLAFTVIFLKSTGQVFGWGFQFQNPLFVTILLTLIFIFSLSLFDVYALNPPVRALGKRENKGYGGSFITGVFAVIVATPCTAPFMGTALGFAFSQPPLIVISIFTALALGFGLPFILLGLFPSLISKIPKPGKWMNTFRELMGFLLLGTVVYLLASLHSLIGASIKGVLWFLLFTGLSLWIFGKFGSVVERKEKRISVAIISLFILISSFVFFVDVEQTDATPASSEIDEVWQVFSRELVEKYRKENKPVFVDFYADWCTSCKVNDATVLNRDKTQNLFKSYGVQLLKGDFTSGDTEIALWLQRYERAGVPLYLLFRPGEEAHVFPEFLSIQMIEEELAKIIQ